MHTTYHNTTQPIQYSNIQLTHHRSFLLFVASWSVSADDLRTFGDSNSNRIARGASTYETRFYHIMHRYMQVCPTPALPGAAQWLDAILQDGNQVTVLTSLPRSLAVKALKQSKLSPIFEGYRVNPELLVSPLHLPPDTGDGDPSAPPTTATTTSSNSNSNNDGSSFATLRDGATLLKCCGLMRKPAVLTTVLSGNR
jgi:hypothetical protein